MRSEVGGPKCRTHGTDLNKRQVFILSDQSPTAKVNRNPNQSGQTSGVYNEARLMGLRS